MKELCWSLGSFLAMLTAAALSFNCSGSMSSRVFAVFTVFGAGTICEFSASAILEALHSDFSRELFYGANDESSIIPTIFMFFCELSLSDNGSAFRTKKTQDTL